MNVKAKPFSEPYKFDQYNESDISDLNWGSHGLRFVVELRNREAWQRDALLINPTDKLAKRKYVEIYFQRLSPYRVLEEADLDSYWRSNEFSSGHLVYEIVSGGWICSDAAGEKLLSWTTACGAREWFICTSNLSAFVLSKEEPLIRVLKG